MLSYSCDGEHRNAACVPGGPRYVGHAWLIAKTSERFDGLIPIEQMTVFDDASAAAGSEVFIG